MSTAEAIFEKAKVLPKDRQIEALHFVNFLASQERVRGDAAEWARFSGSQLTGNYGEEDAIYDQSQTA